MKKIKYKVTKKECQKKINEMGNVCDYCGRKLKPIKTVDNSGNLTFWAGCFHGDNRKGTWGVFTEGVKKEIFKLAEKLVCNGEECYTHNKKSKYANTPEERLYWFQCEVSNFCSLLRTIEYLKNHKPIKTKKEFLNDKFF